MRVRNFNLKFVLKLFLKKPARSIHSCDESCDIITEMN